MNTLSPPMRAGTMLILLPVLLVTLCVDFIMAISILGLLLLAYLETTFTLAVLDKVFNAR